MIELFGIPLGVFVRIMVILLVITQKDALIIVIVILKMTFKLENIKIEGKGIEQDIIGKYDFPGNNSLEKDRTFAFLCGCQATCGCYSDCDCNGECPKYDCSIDEGYCGSDKCSALERG
jgi:hypothetical protein